MNAGVSYIYQLFITHFLLMSYYEHLTFPYPQLKAGAVFHKLIPNMNAGLSYRILVQHATEAGKLSRKLNLSLSRLHAIFPSLQSASTSLHTDHTHKR